MAEGRVEALNAARLLLKLLNENGISVAGAFLFGSFARNEDVEGSDIDLALVSDDFSGIRYYDIRRIAPFIGLVDDRLEIHTFSTRDRAESLFLNEIMTTGIQVA